MNNKIINFPTFLFFLIALLLPIAYVSLEDNVYFWDLSGYWNKWQDFYSSFNKDSLLTIKNLFSSIRNDDYNDFPVVLPATLGILPINSRVLYIISITIFYLIPVVFLIGQLLEKYDLMINKKEQILISFQAILFAPFWYPILKGYPDICGVIFILLSIIYTTKYNFSQSLKFRKAILLGTLLWAIFLSRRWYAYTVVSLYITLPVLNLFLHGSYKNYKNIANVLLNFFVSGVTSLLLVVVFQKNLLHRIINTSYAEIYSAYQNGMINSLKFSLSEFSIIQLLLFIASVLFFTKLSKKQRILYIFCISNLVLIFLLFTQTQSLGIQHNLPLALFLFLNTISFSIVVSRYVGRLGGLFIIMNILISFTTALFSLFNYNILYNKYYSSMQVLPVKMDNFETYVKLANDLENLVKNTNDGISIYGSSGIFNPGIFETITHRRLTNYLVKTSDVDLRDMISTESLTSKYAVIATPSQFHMNPSSQRTVDIPSKLIFDGKSIGAAYKKIGTDYVLANGIRAMIFEKVRPFTESELNSYFQEYFNYYPQWREDYNDPRLITYLSANVTKGDICGHYTFNNGTIILHPGENTPTAVDWKHIGFNKVNFNSSNLSCNTTDPVLIKILNGSQSSTFALNKGESRKIAILNADLKIIVDKGNNTYCDSVEVTFE